MQQRKDYRQVPNFNLIPLEYRKPTISFRRLLPRLLLALVIAIEVSFLPSLYLEKSTLKSTMATTQQRMQQIEGQLASVDAKKQEAAQLLATIETLKKERETLETDGKELKIKQADWSKVMAAFFQQSPGVKLQSMIQQGTTQVTAKGTASSYAALLDYRRLLLASPAVSRIIYFASAKAEATISFSLEVEIKIGGSDG